MSYGTRKAIGGMMKWEAKTVVMVASAIKQFDEATTVQEIRAVLDWMKTFNWFLRSKEQGELMENAYKQAVNRVEGQR